MQNTSNPTTNNKEKVRVLVIPSDRTGVGKFRSVDPHIMLQNKYPNDFHVDIEYDPKMNDENYWKSYQIVHIHRNIGPVYETTPALIKKLQSWGIIVIVDIDDYWMPGNEHPLHDLIRTHKLNEKIAANLRAASYVTTTTPIFADEIKKLNRNVVIIPNGIDPNEIQFSEPTLPSERLRIGWLGGSSHLHDLMLLEQSMSKINAEDRLKNLQFYLCGFDTRGTVTEINKETGKQTQRDIKPEETVWVKYENILTNKYTGIDENYMKFLTKYKEDEYSNMLDQPYVRVWTRPVQLYAKNYAKFDVSLAPIKNHMFNRFKSQLKVIEAGFYKKALIASNVGPYTIDLKHAMKNGEFTDGNALIVEENRNHSDWAKYIKKLEQNRNLVTDLGERLYETVKPLYDLNVLTKTRAEFYKSLIK
jgi:glycosyltransferase involved in cell wall biosynthesis